MHVHLRQQAPARAICPPGIPPSRAEITQAIREACPGVIINLTDRRRRAGHYPASLACIRQTKPEIAACNAGSLNYLKVRDGTWAWPPMVFDNPGREGAGLSRRDGGPARCRNSNASTSASCAASACTARRACTTPTARIQLRHGRRLGHAGRSRPAADPAALDGARLPWQVTLIGRAEIWPLHQRCAELGGILRTGLEDTFYLPDGSRAGGNGALIEALAACARRAGREVASPAEARRMLGLKPPETLPAFTDKDRAMPPSAPLAARRPRPCYRRAMNPIRSVTVDLDGTLLDTIPDLAAAANAMMRELGRPEFPLETVATFVGRGIPKLVARCLPDLDEAAWKPPRPSSAAITRSRTAAARPSSPACSTACRPCATPDCAWR
jgi:3-keto-5-aminohexanoate cleavage enzyme